MRRLISMLVVVAACSTSYDYNATSAGDPEGSARAPRAKSSSQFLRGAYADLLGREPETYEQKISFNGGNASQFTVDEQAQLVNVLDGVGDSTPMRALIVNGLLHSTEAQIPDKSAVTDPRAFITDEFERLLGRDPNVYELDTFASAWASDPKVGPRTVIRAIVGSREYQGQ